MGATAFQLMRRRQAEAQKTAEVETLKNETPEDHRAAEEFAAGSVSVKPEVEQQDDVVLKGDPDPQTEVTLAVEPPETPPDASVVQAARPVKRVRKSRKGE